MDNMFLPHTCGAKSGRSPTLLILDGNVFEIGFALIFERGYKPHLVERTKLDIALFTLFVSHDKDNEISILTDFDYLSSVSVTFDVVQFLNLRNVDNVCLH